MTELAVKSRHTDTPATVVDGLHRVPWIHGLIIGLLSVAWLLTSRQFEVEGLDPLWSLVFLLAIPYVLLNIWGLSTPRSSHDLPATDHRAVSRLHLCIVTKGTAPEVVKRSYEKMKHLQNDQVKITVVSDHPLEIPHLLVPPEFTTRHARYKARALEYFRQQSRLTETEWVLHLDEESIVDEPCLRACLQFCRQSRSLLGQGVILYNNHEFWKFPVPTAADCLRVADDPGRFHLQYALLHKPIFGVHGSFLLVNGQLEQEITWDTMDSLVEDYAFAIQCVKRGYSCGEVHGIVREQSPRTVVDFLRQRRRWILGIRGLSRYSIWPRFWSWLWTLSPLIKCIVAYRVFLSAKPALPVIGPVLTSCYLYFYLLGSYVQSADCRAPWPVTLRRLVVTLVLFPVSTLMESLAVAWSLFTRAEKIGFQVVDK